MSEKIYTVNIVGASGYVGAELMRIVTRHPYLGLQNVFAFSKAGSKVTDLFPNFEFELPNIKFLSKEEGQIDDCDVLFLALPHTQSQQIVLELKNKNVLVVDLSADFRFEDADIFETWYQTPHLNRDKQASFVYGLPELHRKRLENTKYIAAPGCYPTAAILAAKPFIDKKLLSGNSVIIDATSGVSGAGINPTQDNIFCQVDSNFKAYGLIDHRHTPEISKELGVEVLFTPHLAPMSRGILATCYIPCSVKMSSEELNAIIDEKYFESGFVHSINHPPQTKQVSGTNDCLISAFYDERTQHIVSISALDNLIKGAAGQAIQATNLALGIEEDTGLIALALYP